MKILTAEQMRELDRRTTELGIPGIVLMENAGHRVVELLQEKFAPLSNHRIVILCGKGNNGGDGFVVARHLELRGYAARVLMWTDPGKLSGDAAANFRILQRTDVPIGCFRPKHDAARLEDQLADAAWIVAAVLLFYFVLVRARLAG